MASSRFSRMSKLSLGQGQRPSAPKKRPQASAPVSADLPGGSIMIGGGVAIFHLASARVVLCFHSKEKHWFLPKGRRDENEESGPGAEREGFEESGYRNRLLPLPIPHYQPKGHYEEDPHQMSFAAEPVWTQLKPFKKDVQYLVFWYIAETLPPDVEADLNAKAEAQPEVQGREMYQYPPRFPQDMTLAARIALEKDGDEPVHHQNTGVDSDEILYESHLLPVEEALKRLRGTTTEHVVRAGWDAICLRRDMESRRV